MSCAIQGQSRSVLVDVQVGGGRSPAAHAEGDWLMNPRRLSLFAIGGVVALLLASQTLAAVPNGPKLQASGSPGATRRHRLWQTGSNAVDSSTSLLPRG